jgi:ATP-dependent 26S proteasome regulatory subunit
MATNRPDTLDPALLRPGRLDRKVEFSLPDLESRTQIFQIHTRTMACERDIRFELLARLCPNSTGADIRSVCTEAGMYAVRSRRKTVTEKDFLDAVNKARASACMCWHTGAQLALLKLACVDRIAVVLSLMCCALCCLCFD